MKGYQLAFFTEQDRRHKGKPVAEWLLGLAKELGLRGATIVAAAEGFGRSGKIHSAHFFELEDQPQEVLIHATEEEAAKLFARIEDANEKVFYVKTPVEFGVVGE